jgi:hypothetical protein
MTNFIRLLALVVLTAVTALPALAEDVSSSKIFGAYTVHYSTFNSLFVPAEIAEIHQLVRAKDQALINIAVQKTADGAAVPAKITGTAKNLLQQVKTIDFKTVEEPGAIYYLGALRHSNEEVFHMDFNIVPEGESTPLQLRLTRKLYTEL